MLRAAHAEGRLERLNVTAAVVEVVRERRAALQREAELLSGGAAAAGHAKEEL